MIIWSWIENQRRRQFVTGSQELLPYVGQLVAEWSVIVSAGPAGGGSKQIPADSVRTTIGYPWLTGRVQIV